MKPPRPDAEGAKRAERSSPQPIVGVVLAGGRSTRLGRRKAGLRLPGLEPGSAGPTLVDWAVARLAAIDGVGEVVIAAGDAGIEAASTDRRIPLSVETDGPGSGPAAGVLGAARARPGRHLLVLACDLPLAPTDLLAELAASGAELAATATNPEDPRSLNPTCALWTPPALERLAVRVEAGDNRLYPLTRCAALRVEPVDARRFGDPDDVLLNVNTAADWERALDLV
jgi:molybdopterin-guanine dinucleotide biosynthesis protein A